MKKIMLLRILRKGSRIYCQYSWHAFLSFSKTLNLLVNVQLTSNWIRSILWLFFCLLLLFQFNFRPCVLFAYFFSLKHSIGRLGSFGLTQDNHSKMISSIVELITKKMWLQIVNLHQYLLLISFDYVIYCNGL